MTEFRVLPVRCGDAYLLRSSRGDYLFDGGLDGCGLPAILEERKARKLRAAICTSLCRERLGGILDIMEHGVNVTEYWLPDSVELVLEKARRFNGDWGTWLHLSRGSKGNAPGESVPKGWDSLMSILPRDSARRRLEGAAMLIALGITTCLGRTVYANLSRDIFCQRDDDTPDTGLTAFFTVTLDLLTDRAVERWRKQGVSASHTLRRIVHRLFHGGTAEDVALLCGKLLLAEADLLPGGEERGVQALVSTLALAAMTGALMTKSSARFRFMANAGKFVDTLIPRHPIKCVNGHVADSLPALSPLSAPEDILRQTRRVTGHKESLVYQYGDKNCGVLLCSDSRMPFLGNEETLHLDRPTIIASPRQGGVPPERAYSHIRSTNASRDVWVRAHYSTARKISELFKSQPNKLCLNNCREIALQEILLRYTGKGWTAVAGGQCVCG